MKRSLKETCFSIKDIIGADVFVASAVSFVIYCLTAYFSSGYHHPDEHYQILQFANFKRGLVPSGEIPWEFSAKIRSGLQPLLCYVIFIILNGIGVNNPFITTMLLRMLTAVLAMVAISKLVVATRSQLTLKLNLCLILLFYLTWYLPYINVRFSSETWSGIFFIFAYSRVIDGKKHNIVSSIITGIFLGTSILFRYQSGLLVFGIFSWLYFISKKDWKILGSISCGIFVMLLLGVLCDRWLYGSYTLSIFNYFNANIVKDVASKFGTSPWYTIIEYILYTPSLPMGAVLFGSYIILLIRKPYSPIIWCTLPFLIVHIAVPHKELRFLFPLSNFCPLIFTSCLDLLSPKKISFAVIKYLSMTYLAINVLIILMIFNRSTRKGETKIAQYIYQNYSDRKVNVLAAFETDPYDPFMEYPHHIYRRPTVKVTRIASLWQPDFLTKIDRASINLLVLPNSELTGARTTWKLKNLRALSLTSQDSGVLYFFLKFYNPSIEQDDLNLFVINPK